MKRARVSLPSLPGDVWAHVAERSSLSTVHTLLQLSRLHKETILPVLHLRLARAIFPNSNAPPSITAETVLTLLAILARSPSLSSHRVYAALREIVLHGMAFDGPLQPCHAFPASVARDFLRVDVCTLPVPRLNSRRVPCTAHVEHVPSHRVGTRRDCPRLYRLGVLLKAAVDTHGDLRVVVSFAEEALKADIERHKRARVAEQDLCTELLRADIARKHVEYLLAITEIRKTLCGTVVTSRERFIALVRKALRVHCALGVCYKFLLVRDGNARLKVRRLLAKYIDNESVQCLVQRVEGQLWWATAQSNVRWMQERVAIHPPHALFQLTRSTDSVRLAH